VTTATATVLLT